MRFVITAAVLTLCTGAAAAQSESALRTLIRTEIAAAARGDRDAFLAGLAASSRAALLRAEAAAEASRRAMRGFRAALDQRFGPGAPIFEQEPAVLTAGLQRFARIEVISVEELDGRGTVRVLVEGRTQQLDATREDGGWRLVLPAVPDRSPALLEAIERASAAVRAGAFQSREAAMLDLDRALAPEKLR